MYRHGRHRRDSRRSRGRYGLSLLAFAGIGLILSLMPLGCANPVARYKVLSFFFDGVPLPPELATTRPETGGKGPRDTTRLGKEPEQWVYHEAYRRRALCIGAKGCHGGQGGYGVAVGRDTCQKCHKPHYDLQRDDWAHGPVSLGKCSTCHLPHRSKHENLLTDATPALCFTCHNASGTLAAPHHVEATAKPCTQCHDPHFAGNRMLLVDSGTYKRRKIPLDLKSKAHSQWRTEETCAKCHVGKRFSKPEGPAADRICLSCHEKVKQAPTGQRLHQPVRKGMCSTCHDHNSPLPLLIRPLAEKICLDCHDLEEIQTDTHPRMHRADCLLCHSGHSSPRKHLLKSVKRPPRRRSDTQPARGTPVERSP